MSLAAEEADRGYSKAKADQKQRQVLSATAKLNHKYG
jgi:hypothetical protein